MLHQRPCQLRTLLVCPPTEDLLLNEPHESARPSDIDAGQRGSGWFGTLAVAVALGSALATFLVLAGMTPILPTHDVVVWMLLFNVLLVAVLIGLVAWEARSLVRAPMGGPGRRQAPCTRGRSVQFDRDVANGPRRGRGDDDAGARARSVVHGGSQSPDDGHRRHRPRLSGLAMPDAGSRHATHGGGPQSRQGVVRRGSGRVPRVHDLAGGVPRLPGVHADRVGRINRGTDRCQTH